MEQQNGWFKIWKNANTTRKKLMHMHVDLICSSAVTLLLHWYNFPPLYAKNMHKCLYKALFSASNYLHIFLYKKNHLKSFVKDLQLDWLGWRTLGANKVMEKVVEVLAMYLRSTYRETRTTNWPGTDDPAVLEFLFPGARSEARPSQSRPLCSCTSLRTFVQCPSSAQCIPATAFTKHLYIFKVQKNYNTALGL